MTRASKLKNRMPCSVFPTRVGMNRQASPATAVTFSAFPTRVGMNRSSSWTIVAGNVERVPHTRGDEPSSGTTGTWRVFPTRVGMNRPR